MVSKEEQAGGQLVVTGSSAGGIEALSILLSTLGPDFCAPIVIAQHLDPRVPSSLATILAKHTQLPVVAVIDSAVLRPGTVYVVPADRQVEIAQGSVRVRADGNEGHRPKPSIDMLFASAAEAFGDRLIAIVLTGLGSDGSDGARTVKRLGGTVIIEDPMTASFPSMPASLEPGMVDVIAPLGQIGFQLSRLVDESIKLPEDSPEFNDLLERVRLASNIDFSHYKPATIKRRLARQITLSGQQTLTGYLSLLDADPAEFGRLVSNFLIKVTEFFRDREMFDALRGTIIPELIAAAQRSSAQELRLWSAGCATGEEAYSLAIIVSEALRNDDNLLNVRIFATDIDEASISFARRGIYPEESIATLPPEIVARYFARVEGGWEVIKNIRNITVFGQHDLGQRAPFPRIDLTLCRNVLIYFSKELQQRTLQIFAFSLRNGGFLALGKSETTNPLTEYFAVVNPVLRIFRRYGERVAIPPAQVHKPNTTLRDTARMRSPLVSGEQSTHDGRSTANERIGMFLTASSIGVILVDRHYDIIAINASARTMYDIHGVAIGEDLVHLVPPDASQPIRIMLDSALRNQQPTAGGEEIEIRSDGIDVPRYLTLSCYPETGHAKREVTGAVILSVDVTELAQSRRDSTQALQNRDREIERLKKSEERARDRQRIVVEANKQLAHVNSDLRAQNDLLIISAEEAEAATEEIETLNEEMQATNEELETLNEEFSATIEELNTTNDEHEVRGRELQEQLLVKGSREQLAELRATALGAIIDTLATGIAAVGPDGTIVAQNAIFRQLQAGAGETSVQIDDDAGATISLSVVLRRAGEGQAFRFSFRSIASDQVRSGYAGQVRPIIGNAAARGIVELVPD